MKTVEYPFSIVVSVSTPHYGIGLNGDIPWVSENDHKHFEDITLTVRSDTFDKCNAVIMGYNTWKSISKRPLDGRVNIIVTSNKAESFSNLGGTLVFVKTLYLALMLCKMRTDIERAFVIGGYQMFKSAMKHPWLASVYVTEIDSREYIPMDMQFPFREKLNLNYFDIYVLGCSKEVDKRIIYKRFDKCMSTTDWSDDHPFAWV